MFNFFKKVKTIDFPDDFKEFPPYTGKIKKGPIRVDKPEYSRISYYVTGNIDEYKSRLSQYGYTRHSDVRFDSQFQNNYIIIEKDFLSYKIAFHKKK